jgi:hypothetical protein
MKQIEIWDPKKCLQKIPIQIDQMAAENWKVQITFPHLTYNFRYYESRKPTISLLNAEQDQLSLKINDLFLLIMRTSVKQFCYVKLIANAPPSTHSFNWICQHHQLVWIREKNHLKTYDLIANEWKNSIKFLSNSNSNQAIARMANKLIILTTKYIKVQSFENDTISQSWKSTIAKDLKGMNQKILIPIDDPTYFGLYCHKTLTLYDLYNGKILCQLSIPTDNIVLTAHSIQYLNKNNQLIKYVFGPDSIQNS